MTWESSGRWLKVLGTCPHARGLEEVLLLVPDHFYTMSCSHSWSEPADGRMGESLSLWCVCLPPLFSLQTFQIEMNKSFKKLSKSHNDATSKGMWRCKWKPHRSFQHLSAPLLQSGLLKPFPQTSFHLLLRWDSFFGLMNRISIFCDQNCLNISLEVCFTGIWLQSVKAKTVVWSMD